jgi:photoactive yellow protein
MALPGVVARRKNVRTGRDNLGFVDTSGENFGPIRCAWCQKEIKTGDAAKPASHGICLPCLGFVIAVPIEDLTHIPAEYFDDLPYGVIQLQGGGTVIGYNKTEASLSKLDPSRVIGKNFFRDIAPCTAVKEFAGQLAKMRAFGANGRSEFRFLFKFRHGTVLVHLAMIYEAVGDTTILLVKPLAQQPDIQGEETLP